MNRPVPRADARANRDRIVSAARQLFSERGPGAEVREIAERAEVAVGTIYRNYPTKGDLTLAVLTDVLEEATLEAKAAESLNDPLDALQALVEHSIVMAERSGWIAEAFLSGQFADMQEQALVLHTYKFDLAARFDRLVRQAIEAGAVHRPDVDVAVASMLLTACTSPWVLKPLLEDRTPARLSRSILHTLLGIDLSTTPVAPTPVPVDAPVAD